MTGKTDHTFLPPDAALPNAEWAGEPPRLTLRQLSVFVATAQSGSARAAASRLSRSQSAASSMLAELEAVLETRLFDRIGRRLVLNQNGRALLPRAQALLEQASDLQRLFGAAHQVTLRVAASFTIGEYVLPSLVARWTRLHPENPVRVRIGNTADVIAATAGLTADIGFIEGPQTHPDLIVRPWLDDELVVVASRRHPLAGTVVSAARLAQETWVLREPGSGTRQVTDAWLTRHLREVVVGYELGSTEAIKRVVAEGAGIGCLSQYAIGADGLRDLPLVRLQTRLPPARRQLATVHHRARPLAETTRRFLQFCGAG